MGTIAGSGSLERIGSGTLTLTANNTYTGGTTISAGTLQIGNGGTTGSAGTGPIIDNAALVIDHSDAYVISAAISGAGSLTQAGTGSTVLTGANSYTGGSIVSAGTLQIGTPTTGGSIMGDVTDNATLTFDRSDAYGFPGNISGAGTVWIAGQGNATFTGTDSATGGTIVFVNSTRNIGNGGTSGAVAGNIDTDTGGHVVFNRSDNLVYSGIVSGAGTVTQNGTGTTSLSAANTYTGPATINAGILNITGSIAGSSVAVASGGTLAGTGKTGPVTVASGGTLSPGAGASLGTLTVQGNLSLASGATTLDSITPASNSSAQITGTASLAGALTAGAASGTYAVGQRYTLLNAAGGISGTYASLATPGLPYYVKGRLGYDADDVYLYLDANAIAPLLDSKVTGNEKNVAGGIDAAIKGGTNLSGGFLSLFNLAGSALDGALDQLSGQVANSAFEAANQSFTPFLSLLTEGSGQNPGGPAGPFAPQATYDLPGAPHPAQSSRTIRTWGTVFGGHAALSGDDATGAHDLSSGLVGLAVGVETQLDEVSVLGASLAVGHQSFSSGDGQGGSNDVMLAAYGRHTMFGRGYLSGALAYGWHDVSTRRLVTVSGTDLLAADFGAHDLGGRIEAGYALALDDGGVLIPYAAFAGQQFHAPAYGEKAASGSSSFALSYAANTTDAAHTEFGSHYERSFATPDGRIISLDATGAWEHELNDNPLVQAAFESLPGSGFTVYGIRPATDTALLGLGVHTRQSDDLSFGFHGNARVGTGTTILTGSLDLSLTW